MKKHICHLTSVLLFLMSAAFMYGCGLSANQRAGVETFSAATKAIDLVAKAAPG